MSATYQGWYIRGEWTDPTMWDDCRGVVTETDEYEWWSIENGWVDFKDATCFATNEVTTLDLPPGATAVIGFVGGC